MLYDNAPYFGSFRNTRKRCEICTNLTIKTTEQCHWTYFTPFSTVSVVDFEQVNVNWAIKKIELTTNSLFHWFSNNHMNAYADKFHLLVH